MFQCPKAYKLSVKFFCISSHQKRALQTNLSVRQLTDQTKQLNTEAKQIA